MSLLQEAVARGEDWFFRLVEHSSDLTVVVDERGTIVYANPAACRMFGVAPEEVAGRNALEFLHPEDHDEMWRRFAGFGNSPGATTAATVRSMSGSGEQRVVEAVVSNCLDNAAIGGLVINGWDVTERNRYLEQLVSSFDAITIAVANMVELRDPYTAGHQRDVARIATATARELDLEEDEIKGIGVASTIHDIGKVAIPAEILARPGILSAAEVDMMQAHCQAGSDIVAAVPFPWPVADMILQHHERLDGSGYPKRLKGGEILLGSRILAVADVISAMSAHRPYRPALGVDSALEEVESRRAVLYDPDVADACVRLFRDGRLVAASVT